MQKYPDWDSATNFVDTEVGKLPILPTIIQDQDGEMLSLVWSSERSLAKALETKTGTYESRKRGLWVKSPSGINAQRLLACSLDCDRDAILFTVAQRGEACHLERKSCFETVWEDNNEPLVIAICSGRGKSAAIELLERVGVHVYINARSRSTEYLCKSHLHPNIQIVECKPRDLSAMLIAKQAHIAVGFSDHLDGVGSENGFAQRAPPNSKEVNVVLFAKTPDFKVTSTTRVFSEYDIYQHDELAFGKVMPIIIRVSGNAEGWVRMIPNSAGVTVYDSGETLKANGLHILNILRSADIRMCFSQGFMKENPRIVRSISNDCVRDTIYFYSVDGPYGFMSNFYPTPYSTWRSSEHYYQAAKFDNYLSMIKYTIQNEPTAKAAYKKAWSMKEQWRADWFSPATPKHAWEGAYEERDAAMWEALKIKFSDPELMAQLKSTASKRLVEHAMRDDHFGCGVDGQGLNVLGRMLMIIRDAQ